MDIEDSNHKQIKTEKKLSRQISIRDSTYSLLKIT